MTKDPKSAGEKTTPPVQGQEQLEGQPQPADQAGQSGQPPKPQDKDPEAEDDAAPVAQQLGLNLGGLPLAKLLRLAVELGNFILTKLPQSQSAAGAKGQGGIQEYQQFQQQATAYVQAAEGLIRHEQKKPGQR